MPLPWSRIGSTGSRAHGGVVVARGEPAACTGVITIEPSAHIERDRHVIGPHPGSVSGVDPLPGLSLRVARECEDISGAVVEVACFAGDIDRSAVGGSGDVGRAIDLIREGIVRPPPQEVSPVRVEREHPERVVDMLGILVGEPIGAVHGAVVARRHGPLDAAQHPWCGDLALPLERAVRRVEREDEPGMESEVASKEHRLAVRAHYDRPGMSASLGRDKVARHSLRPVAAWSASTPMEFRRP